MLGHLLGAIGGGAQYRKASFLLDSVGSQVLPNWMSLREDPHILGSLGSAYFDGDGVATRINDFVIDGVVDRYILSNYSARKLGMQNTGNAGGVHNLDIIAPKQSHAQLLKQMHTGMLVTELMGQGVNAVTGDYSRGASGFWVENGEILYPVDELTIAGNLKDMLLNIVAIGDDVDMRGNIRAPSMLLDAMTIAGQ